jgi:hypothetical protein
VLATPLPSDKLAEAKALAEAMRAATAAEINELARTLLQRRCRRAPRSPAASVIATGLSETLQEFRWALFAAVHAAIVFGAHRLPTLATGLVICLLRDSALKALEEPVLAETVLRQQHVLEHLNDQRMPIHTRLELPNGGLQFDQFTAAL